MFSWFAKYLASILVDLHTRIQLAHISQAMLFDESSDKVRMSRSELATVRKRVARNGFAVNRVQNNSEALDALLKALDPSIAADMLQFLRGSYPLLLALLSKSSSGYFSKINQDLAFGIADALPALREVSI